MIEQTINQYIEEKKDKGMIGIVYFDIDEFRNINEVKGHSFGDELIKIIARELGSHVEKPHVLARMSGDEFVLVFFDLVNIEEFLPTVERYFKYIRKSYVLDEDDFFHYI